MLDPIRTALMHVHMQRGFQLQKNRPLVSGSCRLQANDRQDARDILEMFQERHQT